MRFVGSTERRTGTRCAIRCAPLVALLAAITPTPARAQGFSVVPTRPSAEAAPAVSGTDDEAAAQAAADYERQRAAMQKLQEQLRVVNPLDAAAPRAPEAAAEAAASAPSGPGWDVDARIGGQPVPFGAEAARAAAASGADTDVAADAGAAVNQLAAEQLQQMAQLEQLQGMLDTPALKVYLRLLQHPEFSAGLLGLAKHGGHVRLLCFQIALLFAIALLRQWRQSKWNHWAGKLWVRAYCFALGGVLSITALPLMVYGKPYRQLLNGVLDTFFG